jgi:hypothetical protein
LFDLQKLNNKFQTQICLSQLFPPLFHTSIDKIFLFFQITWIFQDHKVWSSMYLKHSVTRNLDLEEHWNMYKEPLH